MNVEQSMCAASGPASQWEQIDWSQCEQRVRRLQARIVFPVRVLEVSRLKHINGHSEFPEWSSHRLAEEGSIEEKVLDVARSDGKEDLIPKRGEEWKWVLKMKAVKASIVSYCPSAELCVLSYRTYQSQAGDDLLDKLFGALC